MAVKLTLFEAEVDYRDAQMSVDKFLSKTETKSKASGKSAGKGFGTSFKKDATVPADSLLPPKSTFKTAGEKAGSGFADGMKEKMSGMKDSFMGAFAGFGAANLVSSGISKITGAISSAITGFRELDTAVRNVGTLGVKNTDAVKNAMNQLSKTSVDSAQALTTGLYDAISAGTVKVKDGMLDIAGAEAFVATASKVAVVGLSDTSSVINGLTSVMNAYKAEAIDAEKYGDIFFATQNTGKTTIAELNGALASVVPTAAGMKIPFEQVAAAIATMTKSGVQTSVATTQLRAALVALQKPTPALAKAMKAAGVSLESIKAEGLQVSLAKLGEEFEKSGKSATQMFRSVEAAGAVMLLSGENAKMAAADLKAVEEGQGGVAKAYEDAAKSINNQITILGNKIQAVFNDVFIAIEPIASFLLTTLVGAFNAVGTAVGFLKDNYKYILPLIALATIAWIAQNATMIISNIQFAASAIKSYAYTIATKIATAATWLFNQALKMNPMGILLGLVITAITYFEKWGFIISSLAQMFTSFWETIKGVIGWFSDLLTSTSGATTATEGHSVAVKKNIATLDAQERMLNKTTKALDKYNQSMDAQATKQQTEDEKKLNDEFSKRRKELEANSGAMLGAGQMYKSLKNEVDGLGFGLKTTSKEYSLMADKISNRLNQLTMTKEEIKNLETALYEHTKAVIEGTGATGDNTDATKKEILTLDSLKKKYLELKEPSVALYNQIIQMTKAEKESKDKLENLNNQIGYAISGVLSWAAALEKINNIGGLGSWIDKIPISTTEAVKGFNQIAISTKGTGKDYEHLMGRMIDNTKILSPLLQQIAIDELQQAENKKALNEAIAEGILVYGEESEQVKKLKKELEGLKEAEEKNRIDWVKIGEDAKNAGIEIAKSFGQMLGDSEKTFKDFAKASLSIIIDFVEKQVLLYIPAIMALFSSVIPPPFGQIAGGIAIAGIIVALEAAKASIGAEEGTDFGKPLTSHRGKVGSKDTVQMMITPNEARWGILSDKALDGGGRVATNRELAQIMNKGGSAEDYILQRASELGVVSDINSSAILEELRIISRTNEAISRKEMRTVVNVNVLNDNWRR